MSSVKPSSVKPDAEKKADPSPGNTTILVLDDEPEIRKLVTAMLTRSGYKVLMTDSGDNALKLFQKNDPPIDLLLTDVVAPGMSGPMLADRLTEIQPNVRVLFMSGYDQSQVVRKYVLERGFALLIKPFTMEQLETKVAEILNAPHGSVARG
ncbi:MAG: response regulator [Bryobacteraceae bacterium]